MSNSSKTLDIANLELAMSVNNQKIIEYVKSSDEKLFGNTDISEIGDGTCTGAIERLNTVSIKSTNIVKNINVPANTDVSVKIDYSNIEDAIASTFFSGINANIDNQKIDKVIPISINGVISTVNIKSSIEQQITIYITVLHSKDIDIPANTVFLSIDDSYVQTFDGLIFTPNI